MKKSVAVLLIAFVVMSVLGAFFFCDHPVFLKARAFLGSTSAMISLAESFDGPLVQYDRMHWYEMAAKNGDPRAYGEYGRMLLETVGPQSEEAITWLEKSAKETGDAQAALFVGKHYKHKGEDPREPNKEDINKAVRYLEIALKRLEQEGTEEDFVKAAFLFAMMNYTRGYHILDHAKAAYWFEKIAERKNATQYQGIYYGTRWNERLDICKIYYYLGIIYKLGKHGVVKDKDKSKKYIIRASEIETCRWEIEPEIMKLAYSGERVGVGKAEAAEYFINEMSREEMTTVKEMKSLSYSCGQALMIYSADSGPGYPGSGEESEINRLVVKIDRRKDDSQAYLKFYDGTGFFYNYDIKLTYFDLQEIDQAIEDSGFWDMPSSSEIMGVDGPFISVFAITCREIQHVRGYFRVEMDPLDKALRNIIARNPRPVKDQVGTME